MGVTFGKMGHIWKNGSQLVKWSHLVKWVTLGKRVHIWKNGTHLDKWFTSGQTVHNWEK